MADDVLECWRPFVCVKGLSAARGEPFHENVSLCDTSDDDDLLHSTRTLPQLDKKFVLLFFVQHLFITPILPPARVHLSTCPPTYLALSLFQILRGRIRTQSNLQPYPGTIFLPAPLFQRRRSIASDGAAPATPSSSSPASAIAAAAGSTGGGSRRSRDDESQESDSSSLSSLSRRVRPRLSSTGTAGSGRSSSGGGSSACTARLDEQGDDNLESSGSLERGPSALRDGESSPAAGLAGNDLSPPVLRAEDKGDGEGGRGGTGTNSAEVSRRAVQNSSETPPRRSSPRFRPTPPSFGDAALSPALSSIEPIGAPAAAAAVATGGGAEGGASQRSTTRSRATGGGGSCGGSPGNGGTRSSSGADSPRGILPWGSPVGTFGDKDEPEGARDPGAKGGSAQSPLLAGGERHLGNDVEGSSSSSSLPGSPKAPLSSASEGPGGRAARAARGRRAPTRPEAASPKEKIIGLDVRSPRPSVEKAKLGKRSGRQTAATSAPESTAGGGARKLSRGKTTGVSTRDTKEKEARDAEMTEREGEGDFSLPEDDNDGGDPSPAKKHRRGHVNSGSGSGGGGGRDANGSKKANGRQKSPVASENNTNSNKNRRAVAAGREDAENAITTNKSSRSGDADAAAVALADDVVADAVPRRGRKPPAERASKTDTGGSPGRQNNRTAAGTKSKGKGPAAKRKNGTAAGEGRLSPRAARAGRRRAAAAYAVAASAGAAVGERQEGEDGDGDSDVELVRFYNEWFLNATLSPKKKYSS